MQLKYLYVTETISGNNLKVALPDTEELKQLHNSGHYTHVSFPYWAKIWPASIALSQFISLHPQFIIGRKVAEIAAGLGLPSLVASTFAKEVICTEAAQEAMNFINHSIEINGLGNVKTNSYDWNDGLFNYDADVLLMSDVNYNPDDFPQLLVFMQTHLKKGVTILLSTPQRLMAKPFIEALTAHIKHREEFSIAEGSEKVVCSVFVLQSKD